MKKLVKLFSLCSLLLLLCCVVCSFAACDNTPKIAGRYLDDNHNLYLISKDNKLHFARYTPREIIDCDNFLGIDDNGHYCWKSREKILSAPDAPKDASYFNIEVYWQTDETTGEKHLYVEQIHVYKSQSQETTYYSVKCELIPTDMIFEEWQITRF